MKRPKKILFAAVDTGYRISLYSKFIRDHLSDQLEAESLSVYVLPSEHYKTSYTYEYNFHRKGVFYRWFRSLLNFLQCLFRYDIFHFISGETLLTRKLQRFELSVYKLFGKRVIMHFVGSDIRSENYLYWKEKHIQEYLKGFTGIDKSLDWQKKLIRLAREKADAILVSTPDLKELIPEAVYYPVMLDIEKYLQELQQCLVKPKNSDEVVILHSPSSIKKQGLKGSEHIYHVLHKLADDPTNNIRLILPAKQTHERPTNYSSTRYELFGYLKEADIVIDQMVIGWYGLLSVEVMAAGKEVICYIDEHLKAELYPDCPIKTADVNSLESVLRQCIESIRNKKNIASSLEWVKQYHNIENNHEALLNAWGVTLKKSQFTVN